MPIPVEDTDRCNFSTQSHLGTLMRMAKLLIVDEVTMGEKLVYECIDRSLRDVRKDQRLFGGLTVVFAGDFRQILPVLPRGQRPEIVKLTLKRSAIIWPCVEKLTMVTNMRAQLAGGEIGEHAEFLLKVGEGRVEAHTNEPRYGEFRIRIPDRYLMPEKSTVDDLIDFVFEGMFELANDFDETRKYEDAKWLCSRAILCPRNQDVDHVNDLVLRRFDDERRVYLSSNMMVEDDEDAVYPMEMLQGLTHPGWPKHKLELRVNSSIMLMRNFDPGNGHVNGTRYIVKRLGDKVIHALRADDSKVELAIPRIDFISDRSEFPFVFKRRQFPVRLAYAITTNKSQGQTMKRAGLWLPVPLFTHGQLYVAMSRVGNPEELRMLISEGKVLDENGDEADGQYTDNVVYREVLN